MSSSEESPAQQQARLRRERREAKIRAGGSSRLDKITQLSGRLPEHMNDIVNDSSPDPPVVLPTASAPRQPSGPPPRMPPVANGANQSPEQVQAQEEYLRAMLRSQQPQGGQQAPGQGPPAPEDPMAKLMSQFMPGMMDGGDPSNPGKLPFSPDDISSMLGLPPVLTKMFLGGQNPPQTAAQKQQEWVWKIVHILFSIVAGFYVLYMVGRSISAYGPKPPPPATAQNPFLIFVMGELLLEGATVMLRNRSEGPSARSWLQMLKDIGRDGGIVVFVLGLGLWWSGQTAV